MELERFVLDAMAEGLALKRRFFDENASAIVAAAGQVAGALRAGGKLLIFGNGGSAADAQHLAAEFVNRFRIDRPALAAIALTTDTSIITAVGNDAHFDEIFARQVAALGRAGDLALGISTSGNSPNVLAGMAAAAGAGMATMAFTGRGGRLAQAAGRVFSVPSDNTPRIQEIHITLGHLLCELVDRILFPHLIPDAPSPALHAPGGSTPASSG